MTQSLDRSNLINEISEKLSFKTICTFYNLKEGLHENNYYCPFKESSTPYFITTTKTWRCLESSHKCDGGNKLSFIQKMDNCSLEEAIIKAYRIYALSQPIAPDEVEEPEEDYLFRTPKNYRITSEGVIKISFTSKGVQKEKKIADAPIIITEKFVSNVNGHISLTIACKIDGKWKKETITRFQMCTRRVMILAKRGFPISKNNVIHLIEYLNEFEFTNLELKTTYIEELIP